MTTPVGVDMTLFSGELGGFMVGLKIFNQPRRFYDSMN